MANCYGSKEYDEWVNEYAHGFSFTEETTGTIEYVNNSLTFRSYTAEMIIDGVINRREKTRLTVSQNNCELYACNCIDSL